MATIIIGGKERERKNNDGGFVSYGNKDVFNSICELHRGGFLSGAVNIRSVGGNEIRTAAHTFVLDDDAEGVSGGAEKSSGELRFSSDGASWFAGIRGKAFNGNSADWEQLIADAAADYHKHYSFIEFRQTADERARSMGGRLDVVRKKIDGEFLRRVFGASIEMPERYSASPENFYAVSMRLEINGGAQSEPILAKVYFRQTADGRYMPIKHKEADSIDRFIGAAVPATDGDDDALADGDLVGDVLNRLSDLFGDYDCAEYVMYNDRFAKKIDTMLELLATSDRKELECTHVTVLGISHVEWQNFAYDIIVNGKKALRLIIGLNDSISLYCTNCSADGIALVENNAILFDGDEGKTYALDASSKNFGLDSADISFIKNSSRLSLHLMQVSCPENPRCPDCTHTICAAQAVEYRADGGKLVRKCKGCPYPEVVYRNIFSANGDAGNLTAMLDIDEQAFALTAQRTKKCGCCGRTYGERDGINGFCKLCGGAEYTVAGKKLYRKYRQMLDIGVRLSHIHQKKFCVEDSNIIIFQLGSDRYIFNKLDAAPTGILPSPQRVRKQSLFSRIKRRLVNEK